MDFGLLVLRMTVGLTLAAHGGQKLFGWFGGSGVDVTGQRLALLGFHPGRRYALLAGWVEMAGGLLLTLGFLTPVAAAVVFSVMLVAGVSAHLKKGFFISAGGSEYTLVLGVAGLTLAFTGPGALSFDAWLGQSVNGVAWGFSALAVGLVAGLLQLWRRRAVPTV